MSICKIKLLIILIVCSSFFLNCVKTESSVLESKSSSFTNLNQNNNPNHNNKYRISYANVGQQQNSASPRDSYSDAATELGYGGSSSSGGGAMSSSYQNAGQPMIYHYQQIQPTNNGHGSGGGYGNSKNQIIRHGYGDDDDGYDDYDEKGEDGKGAIGLLGLLGLGGLGGVKLAKLIALLAPILGPILGPLLPILLLPILLPLLGQILGPLLPILPILLLPLLLPFVVVDGILALGLLVLPLLGVLLVIIAAGAGAPAAGRNNNWIDNARITLESTLSEDCADRITCEISRAAKLYGYDPPWVTNFIEKSSSQFKWMERISRAFKTTQCKDYKCDVVNSFKKMFKIQH